MKNTHPTSEAYSLAYHYQKKNMTKDKIALFEKFRRDVSLVDKAVRRQDNRCSLSYYSPEHVFCYVAFRKYGFELSFFTQGKELPRTRNTNKPKWSKFNVRSESDTSIAVGLFLESLTRMRRALENKETTTV